MCTMSYNGKRSYYCTIDKYFFPYSKPKVIINYHHELWNVSPEHLSLTQWRNLPMVKGFEWMVYHGNTWWLLPSHMSLFCLWTTFVEYTSFNFYAMTLNIGTMTVKYLILLIIVSSHLLSQLHTRLFTTWKDTHVLEWASLRRFRDWLMYDDVTSELQTL